MQLRALLTFSILAACMAVTALPSSDTVKYGSGSSFVERAPAAFGNCNIDPGAICGTLATACASAITDSDASVVWQTITCVCAGLWCVGPSCSRTQLVRYAYTFAPATLIPLGWLSIGVGHRSFLTCYAAWAS